MKRISLILFLLNLLMFVCSASVFAAPEVVSGGDGGNADNLVVWKKPETATSASTRKNYGLSAIGNEGVNIAVYRFNDATGDYNIIRNSDGGYLEHTIGVSGLYNQSVSLNDGTNYIMVRAENGNSYQIIKFEIIIIDQGILDRLKGNWTSSIF